MRTASLSAALLLGALTSAHAQTMNPAPPIPESGPSGSNSGAATMAATDFNWVWISLVLMLIVFGIWYAVRRGQSR